MQDMRGAAFILSAAVMSAEVTIEHTGYQGWHNCWRVTNGTVEVIVTGDVGPRILRYAYVGGRNIFKEYAAQMGKSGESEYQIRGGHRLWVAPEDLKTTWAMDNGSVQVEGVGGVLTATQPVDGAGFQKQIVVRLAPTGSEVEVVHRVRNMSSLPMDVAPWALTMMAPGGVGITGFPPRGKHPDALLPTNPLVMWAYTNLGDPRWGFTRKYLTLRQDPKNNEPQKVGLFNAKTWGAYLLGSELFVKQTTADSTKRYPDFGSSFETFTNGEMLELETLGPMHRLDQAQAMEHVEKWLLRRNVRVAEWTDAELDRAVGALLAR